MKKLSLATLCLVMTTTINAADINVAHVRHAGPFKVVAPIVFDSIDNAQNKFKADNLLDTRLSLTIADKKPLENLAALKLDTAQLHLVKFDVMASKYLKDLKLSVKGAKKYKVYADGVEQTAGMTLQPGQHTIVMKFVADSTGLALSLPNDALSFVETGKRSFTMRDVLGTKITTAPSLSPSGRWALMGYRWYDEKNKIQYKYILADLKTGSKRFVDGSMTWMPTSDRYYYIEKVGGKNLLKTVDPLNNKVEILAEDMPDDYFVISPTEDYAILMHSTDGPKKEEGVFEIVHPDDRQPNWRNRTSLARYDFKTGLVQQLTYSYHGVWLSDIAPDGKHILFGVTSDSITKRPTTRATYYDLDLATMTTRKLVDKDGFIGGALYAGGTDRVVFKAGTESFDGIGNRVPEGRTPNTFDYHLYVMDTNTLKVTPLTADDETSIEDMEWSKADKCLYYTAQNRDSVSLFRLDTKTWKSKMVRMPLEVISDFSIASKGGNIVVDGSSMCVPYEVYNIASPAKNAKTSLLLAPNKDDYADMPFGTEKSWSMQTTRGYKVTGFYTLPADFDPQKKYPVIVHYYGGCSPTSRRFGNGSHYPAHYWNALGYITFVVNPSGASGFGQEWASRHVNTMGEGPAQDIIDATRQFVKDVPQCDADHIGCISASYGGFMTQYMMTKDNPFACGVSHAGISSHTSYWGEGYWGYSYSETSAANSFPWTRKDLYVERSPLYNADKIKKPILFTHGTADTNVPIGESIQMYNALRILGVPTAFIEVEGENHGIMDPAKRTKWINSIMAWFQKYLKNDDSWWNAIYTPKEL